MVFIIKYVANMEVSTNFFPLQILLNMCDVSLETFTKSPTHSCVCNIFQSKYLHHETIELKKMYFQT